MSAPDPAPDCLDGVALERLYRLGGPTLVGKMIDAFLGGARVRMAEAAAGVAAGDLEPVGFAMHSLRGTTGNFGAARLAQVAQEMEASADAGDLEATSAGMPELVEAFAELEARLLLERERCVP